MTILCAQGPTTNPELRKLTNQMLGVVRLSFARSLEHLGGNNVVTLPKNSLEEIIFNFLRNYQRRNRLGVTNLARQTRATVVFDRTSTRARLQNTRLTFDFADQSSILEQAQARRFFTGRFTPQTIANIKWDANTREFVTPRPRRNIPPPSELTVIYAQRMLEALRAQQNLNTTGGSGDAPAQARSATGLRLKLKRLTAERRFGLELTDWGNDNIACGGDGVDSTIPPTHKKVSAFDIHAFTADGEDYDFDKTFVSFSLSTRGDWPRAYIANIFLAEKDSSQEFIKFLQDLWDAIGSAVISIATSLAVAAAGAGVGVVAGITAGSAIMPVVGTIIGAIIGALFGAIVAWTLDSLKDDIFESPDNPLMIIVPSPTDLFPDNKTMSPNYTAEFRMNHAYYRLDYRWELVF